MITKKNKIIAIAIFLLYLLGVVYLILPEPVIPHLPDSFKSTEPGDTWQIPGVWAYYTNLSRRESVDFFQGEFSRSSFLNFPLPILRLNHPPEYAQELIRETQRFNFCEELVHPFRESLFVTGWIPSEDEIYLAKSKKPIADFLIEGNHYTAKITLYHVPSSIWARILVWTGVVGMGVLLSLVIKSILFSPWKKRK